MVATDPAVRSFRSAFIALGGPGNGEAAPGDHLQAIYRFWLFGHQLGHGRAPWRDPYSFQPLVHPQASLGGWPFGVAFWPLDAAFGPVAAWNVLLLATIIAAGLLTYAWLASLALPRAAAVVGGLVFALAPYRIEQSGGHLLGWISVLLPLVLLALERTRSASGRTAHAWGALAALALVSIPLSGQVHLALGALPLALAYALVRGGRRAIAWAVGGAAAAAVVGLVIDQTVIVGSYEAHGRSLSQVRSYSADWGDLVRRSPRAGDEERYVFLGWLTPLLALLGLAVLARRRRWLALLLGVAAVVPVLLALGTNLPLYSVLWHVLPPLRYPRVPGRLVPLAAVAVAALVAYGVAALLIRARRPVIRRLAVVALLLLVGADLATRPLAASAADQANAAYAALASAPPGRVLQLPLFEPGVHYGSAYEYYELQAPRQSPQGYSTLAPPATFAFWERERRLDCGVWLPSDAPLLRRLGVDRVVLHAGLYRTAGLKGAWFAWQSLLAAGFHPVASGGPVTLFARSGRASGIAAPREPLRDRPLLCEGWVGRTMDSNRAPFWVWGAGTIRLEVAAHARTRAWVVVDGRLRGPFAVSGTTTLRVPVGQEGWHGLVLQVPGRIGVPPARPLRLVSIGGS